VAGYATLHRHPSSNFLSNAGADSVPQRDCGVRTVWGSLAGWPATPSKSSGPTSSSVSFTKVVPYCRDVLLVFSLAHVPAPPKHDNQHIRWNPALTDRGCCTPQSSRKRRCRELRDWSARRSSMFRAASEGPRDQARRGCIIAELKKGLSSKIDSARLRPEKLARNWSGAGAAGFVPS